MAIFAGNTKKDSLSTQYLYIVVASDRAALRVPINDLMMHWRLKVILSTVQHNEFALTVFGIAISRKFHEIND